MTIITSISSLITMPVSGLSQGIGPILSFNFGAKNKERVKKAYRYLIGTSFTYVFLFWLFLMFIPGVMSRIFTSDARLIEYTDRAMRIYFSGIFAIGIQIPCQQSFVALNQAGRSLFLAVLRKIIHLIPLILIPPNFFNDKAFATFLAEPVSDIIATITTFTMFIIWFRRYFRSNDNEIKVDKDVSIKKN